MTSAPRPAQADRPAPSNAGHVQRDALASVDDHGRPILAGFFAPGGALLGRRSRARRRAGHLVVAAAHQGEFDLVLHVLDVEGAAPGASAAARAPRLSVSSSTVSRTLADAAPCVPCTARKAFISATAILFGSNTTTAPLRRMIW